MLKATGGGGGIGMTVCRTEDELTESYPRVARLAGASFGTAGVFVERYVEHARHVEVQVFGDGDGRVVSLGDRDCSLQRRHQKVLEEAPAPDLPAALRDELHRSSRALCARWTTARPAPWSSSTTRPGRKRPSSRSTPGSRWSTPSPRRSPASTSWSGCSGSPRAVPRPPVCCPGARTASPSPATPSRPGSTPRTRPATSSRAPEPSPTPSTPADGVRVDAWVETGTEVSTNYDPLLAKVITTGTDRNQAFDRLGAALKATRIDGIETNLGMLRAVDGPGRGPRRGPLHRHPERPGRSGTPDHRGAARPADHGAGLARPAGLWQVGVPPSGPMDDLSFRLGNQALGNPEGAPGLEFTMTGPSLRFTHATTVCVTGAPTTLTVDGTDVPAWEPVTVPAGGTLDVGTAEGSGLRSYVLFQGGLDVPQYLGSASTFTLGQFGGHGGRALRAGDVLRAVAPDAAGAARQRPRSVTASTTAARPAAPGLPFGQAGPVPLDSRPVLTSAWELTVVEGPARRPRVLHSAPTSRTSTPPATRCTSTPPAPACASSARSRGGPAPTAARRDCTRRTSTTPPTRSAPWTSPATRRSCSAPTAPASAASSAR